MPPEQIDDTVLRAAWTELGRLHDAGVSHGNLEPSRILVADGAVAFDDLSAAGVRPESYWFDRDCVALLAATALAVGHERAIAAAVDTAGTERIGALIPVVQPAALPPEVGRDTKHLSKDLKALRAYLAEATGVEDAPPLQIKRLTATNIGMLAGVLLALAIAIPSMKGIDWDSLKGEFENATWGWALLALVLYPIVPMSWGTALMGCVNIELRFVPTVLTQLACSFLNLITPNGIGGTALQLDYLHKQGVPLASGGSAMVLSTGVGGAIQLILFFTAAAITATGLDDYDIGGGGNASLWAIAIVAAAIGIVLAIPKIRGKVVPAVTRAAKDIWAVLRNPRKALQLFGGDLAGNLIYPALLGLCLPRVRRVARLRAADGRADRRGHARERRPRAGWDRRAGSRAHRRADRLRDRRQRRARHRDRVPGHHVRPPAGLRVLHAALAARRRVTPDRAAVSGPAWSRAR